MIPLFSEQEMKAWQQGRFTQAFNKLGVHPLEEGLGYKFRVWVPHAQAVHAVGDFNDWDEQAHPMRKHSKTGIWETEIAEAQSLECYKFSITPKQGAAFLKSDPFGFCSEGGPHYASVIYSLHDFNWKDASWLKKRPVLHQHDKPLSIYEVHLGSWKRKASGAFYTYRELANELIPYVKKMGFTHIELMPIMEHPYDPSWGYQITGYYAPTARYGSPKELMVFVDACHQKGLGVILDWVPGHFPKDEHGLAYFDGTPLYEHADERRREHADWGTHNVDFEKPEVRNFFLSNAFFWHEKYHVDGFRMDAVSSMLYLDYSKPKGTWLPNTHGGKENLSAITFLQDLNELLHQHDASVLTIAEESTSWPGVTRSVEEGGLGFDYKWNMGWMHDTLHYFSHQPEERLADSHAITFPITFAHDEQFILPFSHDEVVHLKKSLWNKMPGSSTQKFDQLKLLFLYMIGCPGKKLLFMGSELAEKEEWSEGRSLHWPLLKKNNHAAFQGFLASLLHLYSAEPALYEEDGSMEGFVWEDLSHKEEGFFAFSRRDKKQKQELLFVFNFSKETVSDYHPSFLSSGKYIVLFDSLGGQKPSLKPVEIEGSVSLEPFQGLLLRAGVKN